MLLTPSTNHTASLVYQFENDQFTSFMENNSGFPELRYFRFEDRECWDPDASFFQYCCEKSPKLEEIHFVDYRSSRQAEPVRFQSLFYSRKQFPNLKNLSLLKSNLKLSVIGQFINGNYNLKKLSLDERLWIKSEKESLGTHDTFYQDLQKILMCDHGIEELEFVGHGCKPGCLRPVSENPISSKPEHLKPCVLRMPSMDAEIKWIDRTIFRNEFPELVSYLGNRGESRKRTSTITSEDETKEKN